MGLTDTAVEFTGRVADNAKEYESSFETLTGMDGASCTQLSNVFQCLGTAALNVLAVLMVAAFIFVMGALAFSVVKRVPEGAGSFFAGLASFFIIGTIVFFSPQIFMVFLGILMNLAV